MCHASALVLTFELFVVSGRASRRGRGGDGQTATTGMSRISSNDLAFLESSFTPQHYTFTRSHLNAGAESKCSSIFGILSI